VWCRSALSAGVCDRDGDRSRFAPHVATLRRLVRALRLPFPDTDEGLRSVPGRIMGGIQFFEAQIDDQLLPRACYDGLLTRHQFTDLGSASLTPMHALTWGRRPMS
jgi:hypothetical protein